MINATFNMFVVLFLSTFVVLTTGNDTCRGKTTCRGLRDCVPVMSLIEAQHKPLKPAVVQFLRAQQCGFNGGYPQICCGVLSKTLNIFNPNSANSHANKNKGKQLEKGRKIAKQQEKQLEVKLNRAPASPKHTSMTQTVDGIDQFTASSRLLTPRIAIGNKLSIVQQEMTEETIETSDVLSTPNSSTVEDLTNQKKESAANMSEIFEKAMSEYMENFDLPRTRRSGVLEYYDVNLDVEVR